MNTVKLIALLFAFVLLFTVSCDTERSPQRTQETQDQVIEEIKDSMVFFRKDDRCFAITYPARPYGNYTVTLVPCHGTEEE